MTAPLAQASWGGGADAYLVAIYVLQQEEAPDRVVSARVAEYLGVSSVSVSRALNRLQRSGDVEQKVPVITLTARGSQRASAFLRRHHVAERWLTDELGLDWVLAHHEAEHLAKALSERVTQALWERLGHPTRCPHGNPIPGAGESRPMAQPLSSVEAGNYVIDRILEQVEGLADHLQMLKNSGLTPGAAVEVCSDPSQGHPKVRVTQDPKAPWITLDPWLARRLFVRAPDRRKRNSAAHRFPHAPRRKTSSFSQT